MYGELDDDKLVVVIAELVERALVQLHVLDEVSHRGLGKVLRLIDRNLLRYVLVHLLNLLVRQVGLSQVVNHDFVIERELELFGNSNRVVVHCHDRLECVDLLRLLVAREVGEVCDRPAAHAEDAPKNLHAVL